MSFSILIALGVLALGVSAIGFGFWLWQRENKND